MGFCMSYWQSAPVEQQQQQQQQRANGQLRQTAPRACRCSWQRRVQPVCCRACLICLLQGMFRELGEALDAAEQPGLCHLAPAQLAAAAACVCDTKTAGVETFVRLSEAKVRLQSSAQTG